jgi:hypothetical protein
LIPQDYKNPLRHHSSYSTPPPNNTPHHHHHPSHAPADVSCFCRRAPAGGWSYAAKLQLEDATGRMDAVVLGGAGQQLFGVPPCDLSADAAALARLQGVVGRLTHIPPTGVGSNGEGCAWVDVVLTSCYSRAAAAAGAEAEAEAAALRGMEEDEGSGEGARLSDGAAQALADPLACVYVLHDTWLAL